MGGSLVFPTSFRWGYGWPYPPPRRYWALAEEELRQVKRQSQGRYPNRSGQQLE